MESTKGIYRLHVDCGRQGELIGIFIAEKEHVRVLIESGIEVYWGEVLGKHSEVFGPIEDGELTLCSDNPEAIKIVEDLGLEIGYNPFNETAINFEHEEIDGDDCTIGELVEQLINFNKS